jgi:hypothetical protein
LEGLRLAKCIEQPVAEGLWAALARPLRSNNTILHSPRLDVNQMITLEAKELAQCTKSCIRACVKPPAFLGNAPFWNVTEVRNLTEPNEALTQNRPKHLPRQVRWLQLRCADHHLN